MKQDDLITPRIKLGSIQSDPDLKDFMEEYFDISEPHPFNQKYRILGNSMVHISPMKTKIHIHDIVSLLPKSGAGTDTMKELIELSKKYHIPLTGFAKAYHSDDKFVTDTEKLLNWYKKLGFVVTQETDDGYDIIYQP